MSERMTDKRLAEIERFAISCGDCRVELLQALKAEREEVERLRKAIDNQLACPVCGGHPKPDDNCACGGSGHIEDAYDYLRSRHLEAEARLNRLLERLESCPRYDVVLDPDGFYVAEENDFGAYMKTQHVLKAATAEARGK